MNEQLQTYLKGLEDKYPHELEAKFPRIVDNIVAVWKAPEKAAAVFADLLLDQRGGRQGFPPEIAREIFLLSIAYDQCRDIAKQSGDIWGNELEAAKKELERLALPFVPSNMLRAAETGDASQVLLYLRAGMPVDVADARAWTPLMVAAFNGNEEVARLLIEYGANKRARDRGGYTPLHWAALKGYKEVTALVAAGVDCNVRSSFGLTPLLQAASNGHAEVVSMLLQRGADPNLASNDGWTPLHKAVANGHAETIRILLRAGADIFARHQDGSTPLSLAEKDTHEGVLDLLRQAAAAHGME